MSLSTRTCEDCGIAYTGGPNSKRCPDCRRKRQRQQVNAANKWAYNSAPPPKEKPQLSPEHLQRLPVGGKFERAFNKFERKRR